MGVVSLWMPSIEGHGICHRARGKEPNNRIPEKVRDKVLNLCRGLYYELGPTHASEELLEKDQVRMSVETLQTWFIQEGLADRKREEETTPALAGTEVLSGRDGATGRLPS